MGEEASTWTIRRLQDRRMGLDALCDAPGCRAFFSFNLGQLAAGYGLDKPLPTHSPTDCPRCGQPLRMIISLPEPPAQDAGSGS